MSVGFVCFLVYLRLFCSCVCFRCVRFSFFATMPIDLLGWTSPKWPTCVQWDVKP